MLTLCFDESRLGYNAPSGSRTATRRVQRAVILHGLAGHEQRVADVLSGSVLETGTRSSGRVREPARSR
jgi:hypothetical protein